MNDITAFPLQWPLGWKQTPKWHRKTSRFKPLPFSKVRDELFKCLKRMGAKDIVLSTNVPLKNDGLPYANFKTPEDLGAAVYFQYKKKQMVFACDVWNKLEDNLLSICKTIESVRGIERWGASEMIERAFTGFAQLAAPDYEKPWYEILNVKVNASKEEIKDAWKKQSIIHHPDKESGSHDMIVKINQAYQKGIEL
jgi:hypothetical protein